MSSDPNDPSRSGQGGAAPVIPDYEVIKPIGSGSYGEVWLGRSATGQYCAIKIVKRERFNDQKPYDREFSGIQKFEGVSRSHDSQVDILHVGRGDGCFYYVMELADDAFKGRDIDPEHYAPHTLSGDMLEQGRLPTQDCIEIGIALTTALQRLHENGLVHRDVKPSNIIFVDGRPKLADIGLVASADATMSVVGTEGFIPPEGPGSPPADVYSLGKVLYEAVTGMDRTHYPELPTAVAEFEDRERFLELNAIVTKACRRDAEERYESAQAMHADLILVRQGISIRRSRMLERQLGRLRRVAILLVAISVLGLAAWFYQAGQTKQMADLLSDKDELVREKQKQVLGFQVERGIELMDEEHHARSLLWLTEALKNVEPGTTAEEIHRIRINQVLKRVPRLDHVLVGNGEMVNTGGISPDDRTVATAGLGGVIDFWDRKTAQRNRESIVDPDEVVFAMGFLKDSERIIAMNNRSMRLWDVEKGTTLVEMREVKGFNVFFPISPNEQFIVTRSNYGAFAKHFQLRSMESGEIIKDDISFGTDDGMSWAMFPSDSSAVLIGSRGSAMRLISTEDGSDLLPRISFMGRSIQGAGFLSDDRQILVLTKRSDTFASEEKGVMTLSLMDAASGKLIKDLHTFDSSALRGSLVFGLSRERVLCRLDDQVSVLNIKDIENLKVITDSVEIDGDSIAFSDDEQELVIRKQEYGARYWQLNRDQLAIGYELPGARWSWLSGNQEFALGAHNDKTAKIWSNWSEPVHKNVYDHDGENSFRVEYNPDGNSLVGVGLHPPVMWSLNESDPQKRRRTLLDNNMYEMAFSPGGNHLVLGANYSMRLSGGILSLKDSKFVILGGPEMQEIYTQSDDDAVLDQVFNAAGDRMFVISSPSVTHERVITYGDYSLGTWDIHGERVELLNEINLGLEGENQWATLSPFGKLLAVQNEKKISVISTDTGEKIWHAVFELSAGNVQFNEAETLLAVIVGDSVHLLDAASGNEIGQPIENTSSAYDCEFDPTGRYMALEFGSSRIRIVGLEQPWRVVSEIDPGGKAAVYSLKFRNDGALLLVTYTDGKARLWDPASGDPVSPWLSSGKPDTGLKVNEAWEDWALDADFHPDGSECVVSFGKGAITSFDLSPNTWPSEDLQAYAEAVTGLTINENNEEQQIFGEDVRSRLLAVKERHPEYWETSTRQLIEWHERKIELSENMDNAQGVKVHLEAITKLEGATTEDLLRIAEAHAALGNLEQSADILRGVIENDGDHHRARSTLGLIRVRQGQHDEAKKIADQLMGADGAQDDPKVAADVALLYILHPDRNNSWTGLIAALDGEITSARLAEHLAWLHGLENDWDKAEEILKPFLERTMNSGIERKGMALVLAAAAFNRGDQIAGREFSYVYRSPEFEQIPDFGTDWRSALALDQMEEAVEEWLGVPFESFGAELPPPREYIARDEQSGPEQIDLSDFYNAMLMENISWGRRSPRLSSLANLPRGHVEFDNVAFDVRGAIQLDGYAFERVRNSKLNADQTLKTDFPEEVSGIAVSRSAAKLHFLHSSTHTIVTNVGHYAVHYADGTSVDIPLVKKQNIDDWWFYSDNPETKFEETPATKIAWTGTTPSATGNNGEIRVLKFTWENPHPDKKIATLDFVSKNTDAAPFLIALTAE